MKRFALTRTVLTRAAFLAGGMLTLALAGITSASALPATPTLDLPQAAVVDVDYRCGPGYHIGAGGQRCWPNGYAPAYEIPRGYVPRPPAPGPRLPVLECPAGYHLGRGLQRCWPN